MGARFYNPVDVRFGQGVVAELPELVGSRSCAIFTFPEADSLGLLSPILTLLGGRVVGVIDRLPENPDVADLEGIWQSFIHLEQRPDVLVAIGGGSVLDVAKAICVASSAQSFRQLMIHLREERPVENPLTPELIAIPTTAGTGSEVTPWATVWDKAGLRKYSLFGPALWPRWAIVDPLLTRSLPASVTLSSGLDALSHALEAIWNRHANPVSDALAIDAAKGVLTHLPGLMKDLGNLGLRTALCRAALNAGLAFSNTKTALAHSISYEVTLRFGLPHGLACSFCLPSVLDRALGVDQGRDDCLREVFGDPLAQASSRLDDFLRALGVQTDFAAYGYGPAAQIELVSRALGGTRGRNFIGV